MIKGTERRECQKMIKTERGKEKNSNTEKREGERRIGMISPRRNEKRIRKAKMNGEDKWKVR